MIESDSISVDHTILFGRVIPTEYQDKNAQLGIQSGIYSFDLKDFPLDDLPSGGNSNRISPSEMIGCQITLRNYPREINDIVTFELYRDINGYAQLLNSVQGTNYVEDAGWEYWYSYDWAFFGNFNWEINNTPGKYLLRASSEFGEAWIGFTVIDSRPAPAEPPTESSVCWRGWSIILGDPQGYRLQWGGNILWFNQLQEAKDYIEAYMGTGTQCGEGELPIEPPTEPPTETCPRGKSISFSEVEVDLLGYPKCPQGYSPDIIQAPNVILFQPAYGACICDSATAEEKDEIKKKGREDYEKQKKAETETGALGILNTIEKSLPIILLLAIVSSISNLFKR